MNHAVVAHFVIVLFLYPIQQIRVCEILQNIKNRVNMGKIRRLNNFISKWIKSDLPEERSSVLLLGVTRIPSSPSPARRPFSLPPDLDCQAAIPQVRRNNSQSSDRRAIVRRNSSKRARAAPVPRVQVSCEEEDDVSVDTTLYRTDGSVAAPTVMSAAAREDRMGMETSIDSIGSCSLDVDVSSVGNASDWSDASSVDTLRSATVCTPVDHHLPSYLSLACTINGYSTTTNYDPIRLARSRDASPHRIDPDHLTPNKPIYSVQNNLLSPPNLVPLPTPKTVRKMADNTLTQHRHHQEFYSSTKSMTFLSKESHFASNIYTKDSIDGCIENGHHSIQNKCVSFESKNVNSSTKSTTSETVIKQEYSNGTQSKSFIQQRVERLYGPGALAQGFFVTKRQINRLSESDEKCESLETEKHSKSMTDKLLLDDVAEPSMKQSTSSPTLPVLRHLRPEFRAQLPILSPRKGADAPSMQKSETVPLITEEAKVNGHSKANEEVEVCNAKDKTNGINGNVIKAPSVVESDEKDGHYFLKILEEEARKLLELADSVEEDILNPELSEEIVGKLRSAAGKARLLVSQKMQQFKGLCTNNITQTVGEAFPTTNADLQGFWDMVMLQVDQVNAMFDDINTLRKNNWTEVVVQKPNTKSNGTVSKRMVVRPKPPSAANQEARKQREELRRKMIEDRRKALKAQQIKPTIEIFVPETS